MNDKQDLSSPPAEEHELWGQLFENLMLHIKDSVYFKDLQSRFIDISHAQARMFGLAHPHQAHGKSDHDFFTREHAQAALRDEQQIIESGQGITNVEEKETWPDGHETWASTSKLPLRDSQGRIFGTFGISRDITQRKLAEQALRRSEENLRAALEAMRRDLDQARQTLRAILPETPPPHPRFEVAMQYEPMEAVGGDFFSFWPQGPTGLALLISDVMGHGVSAALYATLLKFLTDRLMHCYGDHPGQILQRLNADLLTSMQGSFMTALATRLEYHSGQGRATLTLAGAGHPLPFLWRAAAGELVTLPAGGNAALGLLAEFQADQKTYDLEPGDRLFFYTDGILESVDPQENLLDYGGLKAILRRSQQADLPRTLRMIKQALEQFRAGRPAEDDILLIGVQVRGE